MGEERTEIREFLIDQDRCPECGGELDTGWECIACGFDALPEHRKSPAWEQNPGAAAPKDGEENSDAQKQ